MTSVHDFSVRTADGATQDLAEFAGRPLLLVNVASKCGFTPQYEGLERLHRDTPQLQILGFPCNQFAGQEPGSDEEIQQFCSTTYDVTFPVLAKIDVNGPDADPLYTFLRAAVPVDFGPDNELYPFIEKTRPESLGNDEIKWNFTKFLVGADGAVIRRYESTDTPAQIGPDIDALLEGGSSHDTVPKAADHDATRVRTVDGVVDADNQDAPPVPPARGKRPADLQSAQALAGYTVGITAARRREELGTALERRGARVLYGPAIRIVALEDDTQLLEATKRCLAAPLDLAVATTGVGFRGWLDVADGWGLRDAIAATLSEATILTRGPKVRGAVRAAGLREQWSPESESTAEVLEHLVVNYDLAGKRVAVQLHGDPLREFVDTLRGAGADVIEVPVYRWEPPTDDQPLRRLITATTNAAIDALTFTSAPAAVNFLRTADDLGVDVRPALRGPVLCAAVGPVTAAPLLREDIPVVQPERFRLGALVREVVDRLPARAVTHLVAGRRVELRGHAVLLDGELVPLTETDMRLLRALAERPGHMFAREALGSLVPGASNDEHAVETAIGRLSTSLGDPAIVQTVAERGYCLAVAAD